MSTLARQYADEFPVKAELVHFNHAGVCPLPARTARAASDVLDRQLRVGAAEYDIWCDGVATARSNLAQLINAEPEEIAFAKNTTHGLIIAAESIPWRNGDNVVTT